MEHFRVLAILLLRRLVEVFLHLVSQQKISDTFHFALTPL